VSEKAEHKAYRMGRITIYPYHRVITRDGVVIDVTPTTFDITLCFAENPGVVLSKNALIKGAKLSPESKTNLSSYVGVTRTLVGHRDSIVNQFGKGWKNVAWVGVLSGNDAIPPGWALALRVVNLPPNPYPLIGRERELAELEERLQNHQLVALIGPTGVGKTRLATELGWRMSGQFPGGAALVDLAPVTEMAEAVSALARTLNLPLQATDKPLEAIADALHDRHMMITLDGCEHISPIVVQIITLLQARAPKLTLLVTSQHVLKGLVQEIYWLKGLAVPPKNVTAPAKIREYSAVKFCVERAGSANQNFAYDKSNAAGIAEICRRLGGVPQALAIAVSRMRSMGAQGVLKSLDEQFGTLSLPAGAAAARHLSLIQMTGWTYDRLTPDEQHFLCRLSIFPSWFTAFEAIAICGDDSGNPLDRLDELENKSLALLYGGAQPHYRLLETQRIYATMQHKFHGDREEIAERHLRYFAKEFIEIEAASDATPDAELREIYTWQIDNVRTALKTALADPAFTSSGIALAGASGRMWLMQGLIPEGTSFVDQFIVLIDETTALEDVARLLKYAALLCRNTDRRRAVKLLKQVAAIYRTLKDRLNLGTILSLLGGNLIYLGRYAEAKKTLKEANTLLAASGRRKSLQNILNESGTLALMTNDTAEAERCYRNAREMADEMQDALREFSAMLNLGELELRCGRLKNAPRYAREAISMLSDLQFPGKESYLARALTNLASYLILLGELAEAWRHALDDLDVLIHRRGRELRVRFLILSVLAALAGEIVPAAQLYGWAMGDYRRTGEVVMPTEQALCGLLQPLFKAYPQAKVVEAALTEGGAWKVEQAIDFTMRRIVSLAGSADPANLLEDRGDDISGGQDSVAPPTAKV
jgi:predicted ATPase